MMCICMYCLLIYCKKETVLFLYFIILFDGFGPCFCFRCSVCGCDQGYEFVYEEQHHGEEKNESCGVCGVNLFGVGIAFKYLPTRNYSIKRNYKFPRTVWVFSIGHLLIVYSSVRGKIYLLNYMWVIVLIICYIKYENRFWHIVLLFSAWICIPINFIP